MAPTNLDRFISLTYRELAGGLLNARLRSHGIVAGDAITITKVRVPNPNSERPITEYVPRRAAV
jgi:hypothetical protein